MESSVYILKSDKTGEYYIGSSSNPGKRLEQHNSGKVAATKYKRPYKMLHCQKFASKNIAYMVELKLKSWKRKDFIDKIVSEGVIRYKGD